jgi:hypothetical protein
VADAPLAWLSVRGNAGAPASPSPSSGVGDARHQPGEGRRRQPDPTAEGAAPLRVMDGTRSTRRRDWTALRADDSVRRRDRTAAVGVGRTRETRRRPPGAGRLRAPLVHPTRTQSPKDGSEHASSAAAGAGGRRARPDQERQRVTAAVSRRAGRLPRHPPLPALPVAGRRRRRLASVRCGGSTISGIPSRPLRSVPASQPSICPVTWEPA